MRRARTRRRLSRPRAPRRPTRRRPDDPTVVRRLSPPSTGGTRRVCEGCRRDHHDRSRGGWLALRRREWLAMTPPSVVDLPDEGYLPSLSGATGWLNSPPLTAAHLQGKVVLINFCTYTCVNWLRALAYLRAWYEAYHGPGFV